MSKKLSIINNYQASAASGVGGFDDTIAVDVIPTGGNVTRGEINVPITITWNDGGEQTLETICTGWTDTPSPTLYIDAMYNSGTSGQAATIICAPNKQVVETLLQSTQSVGTTVAGGETYLAEHGLMHYLSITGACTLSVEEGLSTTPFSAGYEQVFRGGHVTRFVLTDVDTDQPALTWNTWNSQTILWENGAPQFAVGKTHMTVELCGTETTLYGSFKLFA